MHALNRLEFRNYGFADEQVKAQPGVKLEPIIDHGETHLCAKWDTTIPEFMTHACLVHRFQQAGTKRGVYTKCCVHDHRRYPLYIIRNRLMLAPDTGSNP